MQMDSIFISPVLMGVTMSESKKQYRVWKWNENEATYKWLTDAEVAEYRSKGYYVAEV